MKQILSSCCLLLMAVFLAISSAMAQPSAPNEPTNLVATPISGGVSIAFTAPSSIGGSAISNYQYSINGGTSWIPFVPADITSPVVISGLTNGTTYAVKLRAINAFGTGSPSATVNLTPGIACTPTSSTILMISRGKYGFKGVDYTASGVYNYDTRVNAAGCDSILKLNLTIFPEITTNTVAIGSTQYATQNLNVTHYRNGNLIPEVTDATAWSNLTTGAWCWYNNDSANYAKYGRLYNWYAVNDSRGLAPVGYHISTVAENNNLTTTTSTFPESLVAPGINIWSNNTAGTNMTGFAAFPNGTRVASGSFSGNQTEMWLWSSTVYVSGPPNAAYGGKLNWDGIKFGSVFFMGYNKGIGMSVRLVKDVCESSSSTTITSRGLYGWNGVDYTASGTYKDTLINAAGCDSIATLNLTILPAITTGTVLIGNQTWTTNNLAIFHYRNGDPIPQVTDKATWDNLTTGAWCWYNNDSVNYAKYGKLYNWYAVNDPRGFGLPNYRMPTVVEYNTLRQTTTKLAEFARPGINVWNNDVRATNISGFGVYPLGLRNGKLGGSVDFNPNGASVDMWTSTAYPFSTDSAIQVQLSYKSVGDSLQYNALVSTKKMGLSVRLLACTPNTSSTTVISRGLYGWNGVNYTASGTYKDTLINAAGCDSMATLNLTILPAITADTVRIYSQTWTTKNLNVTRYRNGDVIPKVTDSTAWSNLTTGAWCWYNNDSTNYAKYGKLYNWYAVNDSRGLAPKGYHVPTIDEAFALKDNFPINGNALIAPGINIWDAPTSPGTDTTGFSLYPVGVRYSSYGAGLTDGLTDFYDNKKLGAFLLADDFGTDVPAVLFQYQTTDSVSAYFGNGQFFNKAVGFPVRLIKEVSQAPVCPITVSMESDTLVFNLPNCGINISDFTVRETDVMEFKLPNSRNEIVLANNIPAGVYSNGSNFVYLDQASFPNFSGIKILGGTGNDTLNIAQGLNMTNLVSGNTNKSVKILMGGASDKIVMSNTITAKGTGDVSINVGSGYTANVNSGGKITLQSASDINAVSLSNANGTGVDVTSSNGGISISSSGIYTKGGVNVNANGAIAVAGSGINNTISTNNSNVNVKSSASTITAGGNAIDSKGKISLSSYGNIGISGAGLRNGNGTLGIDVVTSNGGVTIDNNGIYTKGEVNVSGSGAINIISSGINNTISTNNSNVNVTSSASTITADGNAIDSKGKISLSSYGNIAISGSGLRNGNGTLGVDVISSNGGVTIDINGVYTNGEVNVSGSGAINITSSGIINLNSATSSNVSVTSSASTITASGNAINSKGKISLSSYGNIGISESGLRNGNGTLGIDVISSNGGVTIDNNGIYTKGEVNVSGSGAINIISSGIINLNSATGSNVSVTSTASTITASGNAINSKGKITLSSYGNIGISESGLRNGNGTLGIDVISSNGGINILNNGIYTKGEVNVSGSGEINITSSGIINSNSATNANVSVTSTASTITASDNAIDSKGKISLSAFGNIGISGSGLRNGNGGTLGIDVISSNGHVTIDNNGIYTKGEVNVSGKRAISITSSGIINSVSGTNANVSVTSTESTITAGDNAIESKGKISLSAYGDVDISGSGIRNVNGTLGIDVTSSYGGVSIKNNGISTKGEANVLAFGGVNIGGNGISNASSNTNVNVTSLNDSILVTSGGIASKGIVLLWSKSNLTVNSSGVNNLSGLGVNLFSQSGTINVADLGVRSGSPISFKSNKLNIDSNAVNAGSSRVSVAPPVASVIPYYYNLGRDDVADTLGLTNDELNSITADNVRFGGPSRTNNVIVSAPINAPNLSIQYMAGAALILKDSIKIKSTDLSTVLNYTTSVYSRTKANTLTVTDGVIIGSNTTLHIASLFAGLVPRDNITLIDNQSANPVSGTFLGINESDTFSLSDVNGQLHHLRVSYVGGDGNDVLLSEFKPCETTYSTTSIANCVNYTWNGITYTLGGTYVDTLVNAGGCDSIATLNLTIKQPTTSTNSYTACDSYTWNSVSYTSSGVYTFTSTNASGCDSVATLNLTIRRSTTSTTGVTACDTYTWNANTYTSSGVYTFTSTNASGCDSVATLNLTIRRSTTSTTAVSACDMYTWNGNNYTSSGVYTFATTNSYGCDSVATLNLTIRRSTTSTSAANVCDMYTWNGNTYTSSGVYTYTTTNSVGCDSVATLNLTIRRSTTSTTTITACNQYAWNGNVYTTSGVHTYSLTNAVGCDSVAKLYLTINKSTSSTTIVKACNQYNWNGNSYTSSGVYTYSTSNSNGCDSVANLNLTINRPTTSTTDLTACNRYNWNGNSYTSSGVYTYSTTNSNGCDSVAKLNLTINKSTTSTTDISASNNYNWNGNVYTSSGVYTYTTSNANGCDSVATLKLAIHLVEVNFFPNPTSNQIHFSANGKTPYAIEIYSLIGQRMISSGWKTKMSVAHLSKGNYFIKFLYTDKTITQKLIIGRED